VPRPPDLTIERVALLYTTHIIARAATFQGAAELSSTIPSPVRPLRALSAIGLINLLAWSVVIGGYVLIAAPFRPSGAPEVALARGALFGLLLASAVAVAVVFLALLYSATPRGRGSVLLSLVSGLAVALALVFVANAVAAALVYDSMAVVGPALTALVPVGLALVSMLLSAASPHWKRASIGLAFGLGAGLGLLLFLLNLTNGNMNVLYE
jgi:hypothetical protein